MTRHLPALLGVALFSFFGLFDQTEEYGDLTGALKRTMAQTLPPYHETANTAQERTDSGVPPGPTYAGTDDISDTAAAAEQTPGEPQMGASSP